MPSLVAGHGAGPSTHIRRIAAVLALAFALGAPAVAHAALSVEVRYPFVVFGPGVSVETGAVIKAFSHLEGASVGEGALIGPYARLRPGAEIGSEAHIGNFVEVKKVKERFDGQLVDTNVEYVQGTADIDVDGRTCRINLEYRPDDLGRYVPLVKGRFLSADGKRGRAAAAPPHGVCAPAAGRCAPAARPSVRRPASARTPGTSQRASG